MAFYRTSTPMIYGGDYRPDDEPPPEAVLEEKRIVEHQFRRPSPSRWSSSAASTSMRPPVTARPGTSRSLRARATGGSPRRSSQRSSAFGNRRSATVTDRGRTASMPAVPIVKARNIIDNWRILITIFWITVVLKLDPDPVILYRSKAENGHDSSNRNTTVVSTIEKTLKAIIMIIQAFRSTEILNIFKDLKYIEKRLKITGTSSVVYVATCVIILASVFELLCDYPLSSGLYKSHWTYLEGISRICLLTIDLQFCSLCVRIANVYGRLHADIRSSGMGFTGVRPPGGPRHRVAGLSAVASEFEVLSGVAVRANGAYAGQLSLIVGLRFSGTLVDVYLCCFHALSLAAPWTTDIIGGVRAFNNLLRLSAVSGAAHYAFKQALRVYQEMGRIRTSNLETENIEEIEMFFIRYDPNNFSFKLFGSLTLDLPLTVLPSFGNVPRPDGPLLEEYRLRSFSITASGVCNLGDFVRYASPPSSTKHHRHRPVGKRESCPASVSGTPVHNGNATSTASAAAGANSSASASASATATAAAHTVCTEFSRFRKPSTALINKFKANNDTVESYKVALLGAPGVGKTTISVQFSTSDYICVYDTSIDEDCACRTIRVMINGQEAELIIIDIPYVEMSIETLCSTYNPNVFIVMYSVVDERSFNIAEQMLLFLWKGEYIHTRGVILVGNKSDLERTRKIQTNVGRNLAYSWNCKFIETSSGIDHNVDKLLVGILAQIKLNPLRERMYNSKRKKYSVTKLYKDFLAYLRGVKSSENLFSI